MADEPNKKIDETLRAYAQERRKTPEVPLHPVTRKLLQAEVSSVYGKSKRASSWLDRLRAFWPQLAFGGSLCVILGVAVLSLRQKPTATQVQQPAAERRDELSRAAKAESAAPTPDLPKANESDEQKQLRELGLALADKAQEPAPSDTPKKDRVEQKNERLVPAEILRQAREPGAPTQAPAQKQKEILAESADLHAEPEKRAPDQLGLEFYRKQPTLSLRGNAPTPEIRGVADQITQERVSDTVAPLVTTAPVAAETYAFSQEKLARASELTNLGAARRLRFVQQTNGRAGGLGGGGATVPAVTSPVLISFQVEQLGRNMRVLDRDGSVYSGALEPQTNAPVAASVASRASSARQRFFDDSAQPQNAAVFNFTVRGTNQTLRTDVVLTGLYFEKTNEIQSRADTYLSAPTAPQQVRAQQADPRHVMIGNAVIGSTNQVPFRAVSQEP